MDRLACALRGRVFRSRNGSLSVTVLVSPTISPLFSVGCNAKLFPAGGVSLYVGSFPRRLPQNSFAGRLFGPLGCRIWVPSRKQGQDYAIPKIFRVAGCVASYFVRKREGAGLRRQRRRTLRLL